MAPAAPVGWVVRLGLLLALLGMVGTVGGTFAALTDSTQTGVFAVESAAVPPTAAVASVGDRAWSDLDHDGVADLGEPGMAGVTVTLLDGAGDPLATDVSDAAGTYGFGDLQPGTYRLAFSSLPSGSMLTHQGTVPGDGTDSDPDPVTGRTEPIELAAGEDDRAVDAGVWTPAPALVLETRVAGNDADDPPGPPLPVGSTATFDYLVTNTGNEDLDGLTVTDDQGVVVDCPQVTVARTETVACTGTDAAAEGARCTSARPGDGGGFGRAGHRPRTPRTTPAWTRCSTSRSRSTARTPTRPPTRSCSPPATRSTFSFTVTNIGTEAVAGIALVDGVDPIACPSTKLAVGASMDCTPLAGTAAPGLHTNIATVTGTVATSGDAVGATDSATYFGRIRRPASSRRCSTRPPAGTSTVTPTPVPQGPTTASRRRSRRARPPGSGSPWPTLATSP